MKTKIIIIITCFASFCFMACDNDYLTRYPLDSPSNETFLTNEEELEMAVTGVYNALWYSYSGTPFALTFDYASDIGWDRNTNDLQYLGAGLGNPNNGYTREIWAQLYKGISRCNNILDKSESVKGVVPEAKFNQLIAETRFLRAYFYFYLNELYGGVPLVTTMLSLEEAQVPRSTKEVITKFIIDELDLAEEHLLKETSGATLGRANQAAALALKSRVALYNKQWQLAVDASKKLMELGKYQLHPKFDELFTYAGEKSKEIIFSVNYQKGLAVHAISMQFYSRLAKGFSGKIPVQTMIDSYECIDGLPIDKSPLYNPAKPFANRDPRLNFSIVLPQTIFINYMFETHPDSLQTWNYNTNPRTRVSNTDVTNAYATFSGYLWRKYADVADKDDPANSSINIILFRYAETLLNYAEAKIELNQIDESVYAAINTVRQRPGVAMPTIQNGKNQAELRSVIRRERKYEFAAEGLRFFDIRRWNIAHEVIPGKLLGRIRTEFLSSAPRIDENATPHYENVQNADKMRVIETRTFDKSKDYLWPIPRLEMEVNQNLVQNPNY
ncbi:RagB/SusD family nutrient uptake outer membrane protein [Sphingobacterium hotanense]|uniref:RagB/SusD family nutrient uptake outer membrane protein n=1 Tax=Sphingobacterium hotanense TaxID=649196 RepID=UPI0021A914A9|nr:RagB/SusD family nutrient uptake outer membrane protein [Sphingobacterium hotanense]MCT1523881.1 RagB/SusD family nutrient uptake outer membrane protein [Sphingobacterium hotanense]